MKDAIIGYVFGMLTFPAAMVLMALLGRAEVSWNGHSVKPLVAEESEPAKDSPMIYQREDGSASLLASVDCVATEAAANKLEEAVKLIDDYYEHLNHDQLAKIRALAGRLMAMVSDE